MCFTPACRGEQLPITFVEEAAMFNTQARDKQEAASSALFDTASNSATLFYAQVLGGPILQQRHWLEEARTVARNGDRNLAVRILAHGLQAEPDSTAGWWLLETTCQNLFMRTDVPIAPCKQCLHIF